MLCEQRMLKAVICIRYSHLFCFYLPSVSSPVAKAENEVVYGELSSFPFKISSVLSCSLILVSGLVL